MQSVLRDSRSLMKPFMAAFQGKVREGYDLGGGRLLIVTSDRISTFDWAHPNGVPGKGEVLNQLSAFWFNLTDHIVHNHMIRVIDGTEEDLGFPVPTELIGRSMIVQQAERFDVECVVRGYLSGSAWSNYKESGSVCGIKLPAGLAESDRLPEPIFTPATKAADGEHDINISLEQAGEIVGQDVAEKLRNLSLQVYQFGAKYALERGVIIADTKFEFGRLPDGSLILIDELLTPDSSRFWDVALYVPGKPQKSFDKQDVRDWATGTGWDKKSDAPELPPEVVSATTQRYRTIYKRLTGEDIAA